MLQTYEGKLLLAMPGMGDPRFNRSVIYMCSHDEEGAMGIAINHRVDGLTFAQLLSQLNIETFLKREIPIHSGGPVETGRGFVLHTSDYSQSSTLKITGEVSLSATVDILELLAKGEGPHKALLALGYAGWGAGQLEDEITRNSWLTVDATEDLLFNTPLAEKWTKAMAGAGIDSIKLSAEAGHA